MDAEEPASTRQRLASQGAQDQPPDRQTPASKGGYSLKGNRKRFTGPPHPDRDAQFKHIERIKRAFLKEGDPVISVDTKRKELIGNFKNSGRTWCIEPEEVNAHDFPSAAKCRAVPYGVYDVGRNRGFVQVGTSADTPEFAVDSVTLWWRKVGAKRYPTARRMLVLADTGGSNGARSRVFKSRLQAFVNETGLAVTVCHYPTGASKWNPVEHRLFSPISVNWAGKPLRSLKAMLAYIRGTATQTGLKVRALLTRRVYQKGVGVTAAEFKRIRLRRHKRCPAWNYTIWTPRPRHAFLE